MSFSIRKPAPTTLALAMRHSRIIASAVPPPARKSSTSRMRSPGLRYSVETYRSCELAFACERYETWYESETPI